MDIDTLPKGSLERVKAALVKAGLTPAIKEFPAGTKTAADAAAAVGCTVAQIAKSVIMRATPSERTILVLTSGAHRADESKLAALLKDFLPNDTLIRADADFIRSKTGFAIGGVAPLGHLNEPIVIMDRTLLQHEILWAAGGTPSTVFSITPTDLLRVTRAQVAEII
jgi:prolyl-tRNA editing enzyme YbaK/EbsC (Cys-tRNA(Pro) deacylase)